MSENNTQENLQTPVVQEKHNYSDKPGYAPCDTDDKECHMRWIQAFSDCDQ